MSQAIPRLVLALGLASIACGTEASELGVMKLGFGGASRSYVWFTFDHYEVSPLWFFEPACEPYERIGDCSVPRECPGVTPDQVPNPTPSHLDPGEITVAEVPLMFDTFSGSFRSFE